MKLNVGEYEIEVKARKTHNEKFNKVDTMYFLNMVSLYARQAARLQEEVENNEFPLNFASASVKNEQVRLRRKVALDTYTFLESKGFYGVF